MRMKYSHPEWQSKQINTVDTSASSLIEQRQQRRRLEVVWPLHFLKVYHCQRHPVAGTDQDIQYRFIQLMHVATVHFRSFQFSIHFILWCLDKTHNLCLAHFPWIVVCHSLPLLDVGTELAHEAIEDISERHQLVDTIPAHNSQPSWHSGHMLGTCWAHPSLQVFANYEYLKHLVV